MAEDYIGFDTNSGVNEGQFANLSPYLGSVFPVINSAGTHGVKTGTTAMTVDVSNGISYCYGVRHNITTTTNLPISTVALAGAVRWDAVIKRFDWSTNSATIMVVPGTAAVGAQQTPPGGLNATPGDKYDQILALVKATNGSTALEISDRRIWGNKEFTVSVPEALPTATTALFGVTAYVVSEKKLYRCLVISGTPTWVSDGGGGSKTTLTGTDVISAAPNWTLLQSTGSSVLLPARGMYDPSTGAVQVDFQMRRSATAISPFSSPGGVSVVSVGTLPAALSPDADVVPMPFNGQYTTSGGSANSWRDISLTVDAVGVIRLHQISAEDLAVSSSGASIRVHLTFFKRTI